jgi:hypothetical protein
VVDLWMGLRAAGNYEDGQSVTQDKEGLDSQSEASMAIHQVIDSLSQISLGIWVLLQRWASLDHIIAVGLFVSCQGNPSMFHQVSGCRSGASVSVITVEAFVKILYYTALDPGWPAGNFLPDRIEQSRDQLHIGHERGNLPLYRAQKLITSKLQCYVSERDVLIVCLDRPS